MFLIGDRIRGLRNDDYALTNEYMKLGVVKDVNEDDGMVYVQILEHELYSGEVGKSFWIIPDVIELIDESEISDEEISNEELFENSVEEYLLG